MCERARARGAGEFGELVAAGGPLLEGEAPLEAGEGEVVAALEGVLAGGEPGGAQRREYALTALMKLSARFPGQADRIQARVPNSNPTPAEALQPVPSGGRARLRASEALCTCRHVRAGLLRRVPAAAAAWVAVPALRDPAAVRATPLQPASGSPGALGALSILPPTMKARKHAARVCATNGRSAPRLTVRLKKTRRSARAQAVLRRHAGSAQVEAQARAVEYGQLFGYDALRPALLERMPPLDEAAYARALGTAAAIQAAGAPLVRALLGAPRC